MTVPYLTAWPKLTPRQLRVFGLMCEGKTNSEIAEVVGISEHGVVHHAKAVVGIFGVRSRHELVAKVLHDLLEGGDDRR